MSRIAALFLLVLVPIAAFALPADLTREMVALDRAYIAPLGLTGQPDQIARAKTALTTFDLAWKAFRDGVASGPGFDGQWAKDLEAIDRAVDKAKIALLLEGKPAEAHEDLEAVRGVLLSARQRLGLPYFLDYITLYHGAMEDILADVPAKAIGGWNSSETAAFLSDLDVGIARWNKVKAMDWMLPETGLSDQARAVFSSQWQVVSSVMSAVRGAVESGDDKALSEKLAQLKPNFTKTFFLFGDFPK